MQEQDENKLFKFILVLFFNATKAGIIQGYTGDGFHMAMINANQISRLYIPQPGRMIRSRCYKVSRIGRKCHIPYPIIMSCKDGICQKFKATSSLLLPAFQPSQSPLSALSLCFRSCTAHFLTNPSAPVETRNLANYQCGFNSNHTVLP